MQLGEALRCAPKLLWLFRTRHFGAEQMRSYQEPTLESMLRHAVATVPYYRDRSIDLSGLQGSQCLEKFPILTKQLVQQNEARLVSDDYDPRTLYTSRTSGSTGEPTTTYFDEESWVLMKYALKLRRMITDLGRPPYRVLIFGETTSPVRRRASVPWLSARYVALHDGLEAHLDAIRQFRPTGIYGTPSWLLETVQAAQQRGIRLSSPRLVWTSAEVLTPGLRTELQDSFQCDVRDVYGSTEFKEVAVECRFGRRHVNFETSLVEIMGDHGGSGGSIVITNLVNRAMPLIRYRIGDVGQLSIGDCPCGRAAPWIDEIGGREIDLIELADGRKVSPYVLSTLIESETAIARYRLYQRSATHIEVRYRLREKGRPADTARLGSLLGEAVGGRLEFSFSQVDRLVRVSPGKERLLIRSADSA